MNISFLLFPGKSQKQGADSDCITDVHAQVNGRAASDIVLQETSDIESNDVDMRPEQMEDNEYIDVELPPELEIKKSLASFTFGVSWLCFFKESFRSSSDVDPRSLHYYAEFIHVMFLEETEAVRYKLSSLQVLLISLTSFGGHLDKQACLVRFVHGETLSNTARVSHKNYPVLI